MAVVSYNATLSTVSFNDVAVLTVGTPSILTANATTFALRVPVSGLVLNGNLDVTYGGTFTLLGGFPTGGTFTSLKVQLNNDVLISVTDFSIPYGQGAPDFTNQKVFLGGSDQINGGAVADLLQGYDGADTINGFGGLDIMNGNAGNDTLQGGDGADIVRGGKDDDVVMGGAGNDFIAGDRGTDTLSGGAGADIFHTFTGAGIDRVTDFNRAEGDQVFVIGSYTVSQVGADVVIDLGGGTQMILAGVQQASLTGNWIFS